MNKRIEVFWQDAPAEPDIDLQEVPPGWYWHPVTDGGDLAEGEPTGPFGSSDAALADAEGK